MYWQYSFYCVRFQLGTPAFVFVTGAYQVTTVVTTGAGVRPLITRVANYFLRSWSTATTVNSAGSEF